MARTPKTAYRWTPPAARIDGERLLKAKAAQQRVKDAAIKAKAESIAVEAQAEKSLVEKVDELQTQIDRLMEALPKMIPASGGGRRTMTRLLNNHFISDNDDLTVDGNKLPLRNNVDAWVKRFTDSIFTITSYAAAQNLSIPSFVLSVTLMGRRAYGDNAGIIPCKRVAVQPTTHNGWFRSLDRYLPNGNTDATNGGYWEFNVGSTANVVAFGAFGNGTTDDLLAIRGGVDYLNAKVGAGGLYFPGATSSYLCTGQITLATAQITIYGDNKNTTIHAGPNDICLFKFEKFGCTLRDLTVLGAGITGLATADTDTGITATSPVIWVGSTAVDTTIDHCVIKGGTGVLMEGGDSKIYRSAVTRSYGNAMVTVLGGHYFLRNAMDQEWPVGYPANYQALPNPMTAWTAGAVVVAGDVRELSGFYIQCRVGGTCAGTAPALKNYVVDIADGATVKWRLVCPINYYGYYLTPTAQEVSISLQDLSGCLTVGIGVASTNTTLRLKLRDVIIGQTMKQALLLAGGKDIKVWKIHTGSGFQAGFAAVQISGGITGHVSIDDSWLEGGARAVYLALDTPGTASVDINRCYLKPAIGSGGSQAVGIETAANQTDFYLTNNVVASGCIEGLKIGSGCNYYHIKGNRNKARLSDAAFFAGATASKTKIIEGNG